MNTLPHSRGQKYSLKTAGLWVIVAALLGYIIWQVSAYWFQLLKQPALPRLRVPADTTTKTTLPEKARVIARDNLLGGLEKRQLPNGQEKLVLCAGIRNFREPWARDFGFASFGLVDLGQFQAVKETLEVFLLNQRPSGQFPVKVHSTSVLNRYLHSLLNKEQPIHRPIKPKHITAHKTVSPDGNALLVIAALNYARHAGDDKFIKDHWPALKQAITWLNTHTDNTDGLLQQDAYADWADSIARKGKVLYTNVLYWKAAQDMSVAAAQYGFERDESIFTHQARRLAGVIQAHFWQADLGHFVTSRQLPQLSSDGNLLAIVWGLATAEQSKAILTKMCDYGMENPVPTKVVQPAYPNRLIAIENRLAGLGNYHTSGAWLWLGGWHVIALVKTGQLAQAKTLLNRISNVIVRDGAVHEVYAPDGYHLSTLWYTSEAPLTWSAGVLTHAFYIYKESAKQ